MSLPKKGFRIITVNGEQFKWRIRKKINWMEEIGDSLVIPVQHIAGGQLLLINSGYCRSDIREVIYNKPNKMKAITPAFVEKCIQKAIQEGWNYKLEGKPRHISGEELVGVVDKLKAQ